VSTTDTLRVLIADDHLIFRDGLRALLASTPDAELVGEAATGEEAIALAASVQPDVVLMDLQMPGLNGIEATRRIVHDSPHTRVLVVTMFEDDNSVLAAMRAGARGYLLKGQKNPEIAARLVLSPKTVRNHVTNILSKLQVADRAEAIIRAREAGLGTGIEHA
jgi:DNA-binding NarL/FixJ family response regulator